MKVVRWFCGILAIIMLAMFIGGLAYSIWENTESIAFPVIVVVVVVMAAVGIIGDLRSGTDTDG